MWYTIVSGKELRDMVQMWKICVLIYATSKLSAPWREDYADIQQKLRNPLIEALTCLHPAEKAKITSVEKIRKVGDSLPCIKPEELTVLTDEWRIYAETDIPEEWAQKDGSAVRVDQYWSKVLKLKSVSGSQKICAWKGDQVCT